VSWKCRISVLALLLLTGLPVSGAACGLLCETEPAAPMTAAGHRHHRSTPDDGLSAQRLSADRVFAAEDDCSRPDGMLQQDAVMTAERASTSLRGALPTALFCTVAGSQPPPGSETFAEYRSDPASAPATATPLVLRV
jgi:hypothetical protein